MKEETNLELEQFRQQWRAEVSARTRPSEERKPKDSEIPCRPTLPTGAIKEADYHTASQDPHKPDGVVEEAASVEVVINNCTASQTALQHYEKAVEREAQGILGESLDLYRKAFRMDCEVDQKYKNKHFPPSFSELKSTLTSSSDVSPTVSNPVHLSLDRSPQTFKQLITSFSGLPIEPAKSPIEVTSLPTCHLADLPDEIIIQILTELAILDVASFARVAQVCKRMAYVVATEEQIWKRVCLGSEVGFAAMHYDWQREVLGGPRTDDGTRLENSDNVEVVSSSKRDAMTDALFDKVYSSSWHLMFRLRPRIRFNGCYISTVNYIRPGQASASQVSWNSPVHIVTYYRYLRFFRDGSVISLLTTTEPANVVHHLTKELLEIHRNGASSHLPSIVMQNALRGRWRLSSALSKTSYFAIYDESDVSIETEGVSAKYMYRMKLSLRSAGKGTKNNKLVWQGFWNYNLLTGDTGEFTLRNDKAFFWSRVKSYGDGA